MASRVRAVPRSAATSEADPFARPSVSSGTATHDAAPEAAPPPGRSPSGTDIVGATDSKSGAGTPGRRRWQPWWLLAILGLLTLAAIALLVTYLVHRSNTSDAAAAKDAALATREQARQAAYDAAVRDAPLLFSFSYQTFDRDAAAQLGVTTGDFTASVKKLTGAAVKPLALKNHATVKGSVLGAAVIDDTNPNAMPVLLFVDQAVKNDTLPAPRLDRYRVRLQMQKVGDAWKVAGLTAL